MVTCTMCGTCHHEVNFAWVDSLYNTCFKYRSITLIQTRQFRGQNIEFEDHTFWFDPQTLNFRQNMLDGYMSRQRPM